MDSELRDRGVGDDYAVILSFKCIHNGNCFEVGIPSRTIRISTLRCDIAQYLIALNLPFDPQSYRIIYHGRTLLDNDSLDAILSLSSDKSNLFFLAFNDFLFAEKDREEYFVDVKSVEAAEIWLRQCDMNYQSEQAVSVKNTLDTFKQNPFKYVKLNSGDISGVSNSPVAGAAPPEPALPPLQQPRWIDLYVIPKIIVGIYLFGENLPRFIQIIFGVSYYLVDSGIILFLLRWIMRRYFNNAWPLRGSTHPVITSLVNWGAKAQYICRSMTATPVSPGIFLDIYTFISSFFLCLYPGWRPGILTPPAEGPGPVGAGENPPGAPQQVL